ncbi:hypothetical protein L2E82_10707 [Cichorium intybus]|uniref:Uncharacterized protein n=1 Tax=Cichorium intybus TaxID=13427 RepID=A0ACB9GB33_CICIN|nr:hypothetical protein L2E82_10707 [Cichorium intybus]
MHPGYFFPKKRAPVKLLFKPSAEASVHVGRLFCRHIPAAGRRSVHHLTPPIGAVDRPVSSAGSVAASPPLFCLKKISDSSNFFPFSQKR